ncbi:porin PorA family protein [Corynebacterium sp.]|uniref:porin PorA family protein n=1 Tax=Corynebacterium sp. TaxID=1720 RepID=UPI0026DFD869|nr:porin PorA family protein [Corynebacterium sp.]MDO5512359.1 porin PorA family protein [Corynebacterium sp.]
MTQSMFRRRPIQLLLLGALLFIVASAVPPAVISQLRPLSPGQSLSFSTKPAAGISIVAHIDGSQGLPTDNRDRPDCLSDTPGYSCFVASADIRMVSAQTTSEGDDDGEVWADSVLQVLVDEDVVAELNDSLLLDARSTFPVADAVSRMSISVPALASGMSSDPFIREGLQYFFPFSTSRQSYPYFDSTTQYPLLLDYVRETKHHGVETYEFHHRFTNLSLDRESERAINFPVELNSHLDVLASSGVGVPRYAVDRTLWVEPESGTIIDIHENLHLFFAADEPQSTDRSFQPSPDYTIFHTISQWDDETIAQQTATAEDVLSTLRTLQVVAVVLKTLALLAVLGGVVLLFREHRSA